MNRFLKTLENMGEGLSVYAFSLMGVALQQFAPRLLTNEPINTVFQWVRLGIAAIVALYIVMLHESSGDPIGKAKNFKKRLADAFKEGFLWNGIMGIAGAAGGQ